tara:strand:- start:564 stop:1409 length:846 start_codon:yes stop_codon:yes gene_type:complete
MSLPYSEFPVYVGGVGSTHVPSETAGYVPATQVNVNYNTTHSPKRKLGKTIAASDQFGFGGPLSADISFDCILQSGLVSGLDFLLDASQDNFVTIQIGSGVYNKCYATDVSVSIAPFAPVTLQAKFVSLDPVTGSQISGDSNPFSGGVIPFDSDAIAYGHTCTITDSANILNNVQSQISFTRRYSRSPTYALGSVNASTMLLDGVEEELSVVSTGVNSLINFSGEELANTLSVGVCGVGTTAPFITDFISFPAGSRVLAESYNTKGGDVVTTNATIKQIKL